MFRLLPWLWLPAGIVVAATVLRDNMPPLADPQAWLVLLLVAPCGLPLAGACRRLLRMGYPVTAWAVFAVLGPFTAVASLFAGLLGPVAILAYALVLSAPAWLLYALLRRGQRRRRP